MARVRAILAALLTAERRGLKTLGSFSGNNLFVVGIVLLALKDPGAFVAIAAFIGAVLFIPLSANPLRVLPPDRLGLWPLNSGERRALQVLSPWLNPVTWLICALAVWKRITIGLCAVAAGMFAIGFVLPSLPVARRGLWRRLPNVPGRLNHLIRKNVREMLSTLDFWCAAVISALTLGFRAARLLPPEALLPMTILVMLAISTYAQTLFGLDGDSGMTRYRLLPAPGWQILVAKDAPFFLISILLTLPLSPLAGFTAALSALAAGRYASVVHHGNQARWRFSSGASFGMSLIQIIIVTLAAGSLNAIPLMLVFWLAAYACATWWCGRLLSATNEHA